jgi:hypothetical protein
MGCLDRDCLLNKQGRRRIASSLIRNAGKLVDPSQHRHRSSSNSSSGSSLPSEGGQFITYLVSARSFLVLHPWESEQIPDHNRFLKGVGSK